MNMHVNIPIDRGSFVVDRDTRDFLRTLTRFSRWKIWPYGWWTEANGSFVIFDGKYRPICRKRPNGMVELLPSDVTIAYVDQDYLYTYSTHPDGCLETRERLYGVVRRLRLGDEIERRRVMVARRQLPTTSRTRAAA
ncbi:hypothetical protein NKH75_23900 [Mesorhizobium sp. M0984]|uniref:hypothetical protein n=1 Tax=Mesorhizobium sp. M0984 TaxID=2957041 RepID=UPI00333BF67F